jgi:putative transposase
MEHRDRLMVTQAYRFALDPTPRQVRDLLRHAGPSRVAYNWGLARIKANLSQRAAERSYGITDVDLTPCLSWSMYAMRKDWNQAKQKVAPWWAECSKEAYNTGPSSPPEATRTRFHRLHPRPPRRARRRCRR